MLTSIDHLGNEGTERALEVAHRFSARYEQFLDDYKEDGHRAPGIHASELGCARRLVYNLLGTEQRKKIPAVWRKRFKIGHAVHSMLQDDFKKMVKEQAQEIARQMVEDSEGALLFEDEAPINPSKQEFAAKWCVYSSCDGIFTFRQREHENAPWKPYLRMGLEIKTESPDGFEKLRKPKEQHVEQAHLYMKLLDLPIIWFLYYNKGNQNTTPSEPPWLVTFNPLIWAKVEAKIYAAHESAEAGQLPERDEGPQCEFCPFAWACQPKYLAKKMVFNSPRRPIRRV